MINNEILTTNNNYLYIAHLGSSVVSRMARRSERPRAQASRLCDIYIYIYIYIHTYAYT